MVAATAPVRDVTAARGANLQDAGTVLTTYANTVEIIQRELDALRTQAIDPRAQADATAPDGWAIAGRALSAVATPYLALPAAAGIASDIAEPWRDDPGLVARHNALIDAVAVQVAAFTDAERRCVNDLRALHGRPPLSLYPPLNVRC